MDLSEKFKVTRAKPGDAGAIAEFVAAATRGRVAAEPQSVLERFGAHTLLEAAPETGRTHQIRAHLAALELPIVGDALYHGGQGLCSEDIAPGTGNLDGSHRALISRVALHALRLQFAHPATGKPMCFEAPYPADLAATLARLRA